MTSEKHDLSDDILDQATQALRGTPIPPGPPPEVLQRVLDTPSRDIEIAKSIPILEKLQLLKPLAKIAAVLVIAAGVIGLFTLMFPDGGNGGSGSAFADVVQTILTAKTAVFQAIVTIEGSDAQMVTGKFMEPGLMRQEITEGGLITTDWKYGKMVVLLPEKRKSISYELQNIPDDPGDFNIFLELKRLISEAKENIDESVESLGEKEIDGEMAIGYHAHKSGDEMTIWAGKESLLPLRIELSMTAKFGRKMTVEMTDFSFNTDLNPSDFDLAVPADYATLQLTMDLSDPKERGLLETFRWWVGLSSMAFADIAQPFLTAHTGTYKITITIPGQPTQTSEGMFMEPAFMRNEMVMGPVQIVQLFDMQKAQMLQLMPAQKIAMQIEMQNLPEEKRNLQNMNMFHECRKLVEDAKENPEVIVEELGEQMLEGQLVIGYRLKAEEGMYFMTVWADPATKLPQQIEISMGQMFGGTESMEILVHDFEFNVPLTPSLFSMEIPPGYQVVPLQMEASEPSEKDLVQALQLCADLSNGHFPETLDIKGLKTIFQNLQRKKVINFEGGEKPIPKHIQKILEISVTIGRGITFAHMLPAECDWHYAGKDVTMAEADTPIFWYRPIGSENYRVIYADLEIEDCLPDDVPEAPQEEEKTGILDLRKNSPPVPVEFEIGLRAGAIPASQVWACFFGVRSRSKPS